MASDQAYDCLELSGLFYSHQWPFLEGVSLCWVFPLFSFTHYTYAAMHVYTNFLFGSFRVYVEHLILLLGDSMVALPFLVSFFPLG